jgi:hypothetical protein
MNKSLIIFIISIIIILITFIFFYYFSSKSNIETFINPNDYYFLSKEEVLIFMNNDEDNYIKKLSIYDLKARKVKTSNEYLDLISHSCMDFTQEQKEKLIISAFEASQYFNNGFKWKFGLLSSNYEEGFPHTRTDIIFLSPAIVNYEKNELTKILIHESIHIYQRYNTLKIDEYLKNNGYVISRIKNDPLIRANPDLNDIIYKDKNGIELVAYYNSKEPKGINDVKLNNLNNEHPFEKMAYEIADNYYKSLMIKKYKEI